MLPKSFSKSLDEIANTNFYQSKNTFLIHFGESLIMHICSFILAEYKESGLLNLSVEKHIANSKTSLSMGIYLGWIRETGAFLSKNGKSSRLDEVIFKTGNHEALAEFNRIFELMKKTTESAGGEFSKEEFARLLKGYNLKQTSLYSFLDTLLQLRNKVAHPIYEIKGKQVKWPHSDDYFQIILPALETGLQYAVAQLAPLWDYGIYEVKEYSKDNVLISSEDMNAERTLSSHTNLEEGWKVLVSQSNHLLPADWKLLLSPSKEALEKIKEEREELRKMSNLAELEEQIKIALDDNQISVEEFKFFESISRTKLNISSEELRQIIFKTAEKLGIENPFPEVDARFLDAIDHAIKSKSFNELVLRLMGEQFGINSYDFDKIVDSRAYALGVSPQDARTSDTISFTAEDLEAFHSLTMARIWLHSINLLNSGGGDSNYTLTGSAQKLGTKEYWHKNSFLAVEKFVKHRLKKLQKDDDDVWETNQNQWQIGKMTSYAWCCFFPANAITKKALALHLSLYGSGGIAVGFLPDWKDYKSIEHFGLLTAITRKNIAQYFHQYKESFLKYPQLVIWNRFTNDAYCSVGDAIEKHNGLIENEYFFEQIQFTFTIYQLQQNPKLLSEAFDIVFNLFSNIIRIIIDDYTNTLPSLIDPLASNEAFIKELLNRCIENVKPYIRNYNADDHIIKGSPSEGRFLYMLSETSEKYPLELRFIVRPDYDTQELYFEIFSGCAGSKTEQHQLLESIFPLLIEKSAFPEKYTRPGRLYLRKIINPTSEDMNAVLDEVQRFLHYLTIFTSNLSNKGISYFGLVPVLPLFQSVESTVGNVLDELKVQLQPHFSKDIAIQREIAGKLKYIDYSSSNKKYGHHWIGWGVKIFDERPYWGVIVHIDSIRNASELISPIKKFISADSDWVISEESLPSSKSDAVWLSEKLPDSSFKASSEWNKNHSAKLARLNSEPKFANWSSKVCNADQWIQIDLGDLHNLWEVAIQGRFNNDQWVAEYHVEVSINGNEWSRIGSNVEGATDRDTPVIYILDVPSLCRFVRIIPVQWHKWISMRLDVLAGPVPDQSFECFLMKDIDSFDNNGMKQFVEEVIVKLKGAFKGSFGF